MKKPRSEWSVAYRKRIERAEARGKTRQQARGHKATEHKTRKPRGALSTKDKEYIKAFWKRQVKRMNNPDAQREKMVVYAERYGMDRFRSIVNTQKALRRRFKSLNTLNNTKRFVQGGGKLRHGKIGLGEDMARAIASLSLLTAPSERPSTSGLLRGGGGSFGYEGEDEGDFDYDVSEDYWEDLMDEDEDTTEWLHYHGT